MNISFIIPSKNNIKYLKNAYDSIRKYYKNHEIVILDDCSSDGTVDWLNNLSDDNLTKYFNNKSPVGHTVLYNIGVEICKNEIFSIFHADMICGPYYVENLLKHLKDKTVVSATRIEPPLHPAGKEKIVKNFGLEHDDLKIQEFEDFCISEQKLSCNITTKGIFAPWCMYKKDFMEIGGHDVMFAPFPYEDSDIFQRFILNGYEIIQSRDSLVYHLTCRGHRWTEKIQKDDDFYKKCCDKNYKNYIRKWGSWIENDEYSYPIINSKYDVGLIVNNCNPQLLNILEYWCSTIYVDCDIKSYINNNQSLTPFNLKNRVKTLKDEKVNDILIQFDGNKLNNNNIQIISNLSKILKDSGEIGNMEFDIFKFTIKSLNTYENNLIVVKN